VYHGSASGLAETSAWTAESDQADARFGISVSGAGDVNGDGYADVIVGANRYDNGQENEGRAYVYHGAASGLSAIPNWTAEGDQAFAYFGGSVSGAGDVNGDGYADVIVGSSSYDGAQADLGRAFIYAGSASGLSSTAAWTLDGDQQNAGFAYPVSDAGDVDGDGYADVLVAAPSYTNGEPSEGRAFLFLGSASGVSPTPAWIAEGNQVDAQFGECLSGAGDVNGDGYADVVVGAWGYGAFYEGKASVYLGSTSGLSGTPSWTITGDKGNVQLGEAVAAAGDVNGDGYGDVIVGSPNYVNGEHSEGGAYVYHGSAGGLSETLAWTAESDQMYANFGHSVSSAGDVNGDGYADVIVGASGYDNGENSEGRAYVYYGSASGLCVTPAWTAESNQEMARFGSCVSGVGDVNGDGYADVVVGAHCYDSGANDEGRAFLYLGVEGDALSLVPQLRRSDYTPFGAPGVSSGEDAIRLQILAKSRSGRMNVRLEWEIKPYGTPFDGKNTGVSNWANTGVSGYPFDELVTGLGEENGFRCRMRLLYDPVRCLGQQRSRWFYPQWPTQGPSDFRTSGYRPPTDPGALSVTQTPLLTTDDIACLGDRQARSLDLYRARLRRRIVLVSRDARCGSGDPQYPAGCADGLDPGHREHQRQLGCADHRG